MPSDDTGPTSRADEVVCPSWWTLDSRFSFLTWLDRLTAGNRRAKALLVFPAASAVFTLVMMLLLAGFFDPTYYSASADSEIPLGERVGEAVFAVLFIGLSLLPAAGLMVLISWVARRLPRGLPAVAVGCLAFTAATVWAYLSIATDESSTAALGLPFLPPALGLLLLSFAGLAVLVNALRNREMSR